MNQKEWIAGSVLRDMSEGVLAIGFDGKIVYMNAAAEKILERREEELVGAPFALCFFGLEANDAFNQLVLDAVYDQEQPHQGIVPYTVGGKTRQLRVTTSFLRENGKAAGIIAVLADLSELMELRDAVQAMQRIKALNRQLELRNQLISETFGRYLSDEIVRQLLDTPDGLRLGGKRRTLTVLMSDLRGFTALSERMQANDLIDMLNHYLGEMTEVIQAHHGTIIEFIGDGILAIFGAPVASETHAADAVRCAVEMQSRMDAVNAWNAAHGYNELEMGIAVHSGPVIVGNIGSRKRTKYGVVGVHVNLCGRIESYTVGGQVLISAFTRDMIPEPVTAAREMTVYPKGIEGALTLYDVTGIGDVSCRRETEPPQALPAPRQVMFRVLQGKHGSDQAYAGAVLGLSRRESDLRTEHPLQVYDNVFFELPKGKLYAKVMQANAPVYRLTFTSKPEGFDAWLSQDV